MTPTQRQGHIGDLETDKLSVPSWIEHSFSIRIRRDDTRLELEQVRVVGVDSRADPMSVPGAEGFNAGEVRENAAAWTIQRLIELEIVAVAVDQRDLTAEAEGLVDRKSDV